MVLVEAPLVVEVQEVLGNMKFKKAISITKYSLLIIFAIIGIGVDGAVPVQNSKKENSLEVDIELVEERNDVEEEDMLELKL